MIPLLLLHNTRSLGRNEETGPFFSTKKNKTKVNVLLLLLFKASLKNQPVYFLLGSALDFFFTPPPFKKKTFSAIKNMFNVFLLLFLKSLILHTTVQY